MKIKNEIIIIESKLEHSVNKRVTVGLGEGERHWHKKKADTYLPIQLESSMYMYIHRLVGWRVPRYRSHAISRCTQ